MREEESSEAASIEEITEDDGQQAESRRLEGLSILAKILARKVVEKQEEVFQEESEDRKILRDVIGS
jgi:hypothetical protein